MRIWPVANFVLLLVFFAFGKGTIQVHPLDSTSVLLPKEHANLAQPLLRLLKNNLYLIEDRYGLCLQDNKLHSPLLMMSIQLKLDGSMQKVRVRKKLELPCDIEIAEIVSKWKHKIPLKKEVLVTIRIKALLVKENPFAGCWIDQTYAAMIEQTKSPRKSQDGALMICIPEHVGEKTSYIYNFHEGGAVLELQERNDQWSLIESPQQKKSKAFVLKRNAQSNLLLDTTTFISFATVKEKDNPLIDLLFQGIWKTQNGAAIRVGVDGSITGMQEYKEMRPMLDYWDAGLNVDMVEMVQWDGQIDMLGFLFQGDTLSLFKLRCVTMEDEMCVERKLGELLHQWVKEP